MKYKKIVFISLAVLIAIGIGALLFFCFSNGLKTEKAERTDASETSSLPGVHTASNRNQNQFILRQVKSDDKTVTIQLSVDGKVSLCRYNMILQYDPACLQLKDYNADLSAYAPVVNPEKNADGTIASTKNDGAMNLVWANAKNLTKPGDIMTVVFEKKEAFTDSTSVFLDVKEVGTFENNIVKNTDYNTEGLLLK